MTAPAVEEKPATAAETVAGALADEAAPEAPDAPEGDGQGDDEPSSPVGDEAPAVRDDGKPFTRADHKALNTALKAARKEARDTAAELTRLRDTTGGKDAAQLVADAEQRASEKFKPLMVKAAARAAFTEAGLVLPAGRADEVYARAVRLLDADTLTITADGLVEGLAEQVEGIRADFPDLFAGAARRAPRISAADKPGGAVAPKTSAERLAAQLLGQRAS